MKNLKHRFMSDVARNPILSSVVLLGIVVSILLIAVLYALHKDSTLSHNTSKNDQQLKFLVYEDTKINNKLKTYLIRTSSTGQEKFNTVCEDFNHIKFVMNKVEENVFNQFYDLVVEKRVQLSQEDIEKDIEDHSFIVKELAPTDCKSLSNEGNLKVP